MIELIISMLLVAVLLGLAVPAMQEFRVRANVSTTTNDLVVSLNLARAEAVKRGRDVAVIAVGGNWSQGWTVTPVAVAQTLSQRPAVETAYRVLGQGLPGGAPADRVVFGATGALNGATSFNFSVCRPTYRPGDAQSRRIAISATGTITTRRDTTSAPAGSCA